ncbi:MAG: hypothetical protein E7055_22505 [Lentisphaerae bacterium]|nr:hypothetical protein [Lentisphaerota bacterium]
MRFFLTTVCCISAIAVFSAEPMMKVTVKNLDRKGKQYTQKSWNIQFHHASMILKNTIGEEGKLASGVWGDYFFGLDHGRVNNGSWCGWNFMEVLDAAGKNLTRSAPVNNVSFIKFDGGSYADFAWEKGSVKVLQFQNMKDWIFVKTTVPSGIRQVRFTVWPGGTHWKVTGRERRVKIGSEDLELNGNVPKAVPFAGTECGMVFYNRNYNEQYGNFLVFEPDKVEKISGTGVNAMNIRFNVKTGVRELCFALGYFAKEDPGDAAQRFLTERLPNVKKALDTVNWNPVIDVSSFESAYKQVQLLVSAMESSLKQEEERKLKELRNSFDQAKSSSDAAGCARALDDLRAMRERVGKTNLKTLL